MLKEGKTLTLKEEKKLTQQIAVSVKFQLVWFCYSHAHLCRVQTQVYNEFILQHRIMVVGGLHHQTTKLNNNAFILF